MSRKDARFVRESVLAAAAALALLVGFNAVTDPTRSLFPDRGVATQVANDRAVKLDALLARPDTPELLVMGSSSSAVIPPDAMAHALGYRSGYNLALVDGTPAEALAILQRLHAQGRAPKAITYGLDPMPFANPGGLPSERKKLLPGQGAWDRLRVAARHLTAPLPASLMDYRATLAAPLVVLDRADGHMSYPLWDAALDSDPLAYDAKVRRQAQQGLRLVFHPGPFHDLRRLDAWLRDHRIAPLFFFPPIHPDVLSPSGIVTLAEFHRRSRAALDRPLTDLTRLEAMSATRNFYDPIHYRTALAHSIAERLAASQAHPHIAAPPHLAGLPSASAPQQSKGIH
jgi:hypothetical protein